MMNFLPPDIEQLEKTADALSVYMGKLVLAEIGKTEDGYEWIAFGTPLENNDEPDSNTVIMQMGGSSARLIGGSAFLEDFNRHVYQCKFLWGIQIGEPPLRFTRIDAMGDEVDYSDTITDLLPFSINDNELLATPDNTEEDDHTNLDNDASPQYKQYH